MPPGRLIVAAKHVGVSREMRFALIAYCNLEAVVMQVDVGVGGQEVFVAWPMQHASVAVLKMRLQKRA